MINYQLAQVNVSRMKGTSINDPEMKDFRDHTGTIHLLADEAPGFVWRPLFDPNATSSFLDIHDPQVLINLSVWEDVASLKDFTYNTFHSDIMKRQREWFQKYETAHYALWWIEAGDYPSVKQAIEKLNLLEKYGATKEVFSFKNIFEKPSF